MIHRALLAIALSLFALWGLLVVFLVIARPKGSLIKEALRILPDTIRLLRRLASDASLPKGVRIRLWLTFGYLAIPVDIIPDFLPVIGYADDVIIVCAALRSVVRRAGADAIHRHWPGTQAGLTALLRVAGLGET